MQESDPTFSVIIPTHNRARLIVRALGSAQAQTVSPLEIIIVDDGSADDTPAILAAQRDERLKVLRNEPARGVSASRNHGVAAATSDFVVFLDDDDELRANALEQIRNCVRAHADVDFAWGARLIHEKDAAGREVGQREDDWSNLPPRMTGTTFLPMVLAIATNSAFAIRRRVFAELGGFDETLKVSEDRDLFLALAERGHVGAAVTATVIDVDEHFASSLSRTVVGRMGPEIDLRVIEKHRKFLELPEHREFLNSYLTTVYAGFLQAGRRQAALRIVRELSRRGALDAQVIRKYLRHAPEFRALKSFLRYDSIRRLLYRRQTADS
jgi:glycosyltransferase involved in cell wall biosynthesis